MQFMDEVLRLLGARFPLVQAERAQEMFSVRINGHLAPLENLYRTAAQDPKQVQHHIERWVVELLRAAEGSPDQEAGFDQIKERILPMVFSPARPDLNQRHVVSQSLVEGLNVGYAIDSDRTIAYISPSLFAKWHITMDELHETALGNLVSRSNAISAQAAQDEQGQVNLVMIQTLDGYDSSRILLPSLHAQLREMLGSPFVAGIPTRDILLCFRNEEQTVGRMHERIKQDYRVMPHQVTDQLFLVTADGIAPCREE